MFQLVIASARKFCKLGDTPFVEEDRVATVLGLKHRRKPEGETAHEEPEQKDGFSCLDVRFCSY